MSRVDLDTQLLAKLRAVATLRGQVVDDMITSILTGFIQPVIDAVSNSVGVIQNTTKEVFLTGFGSNKIFVIKAVRIITGLGLKEAKELADNAGLPSSYNRIGGGYTVSEADEIQRDIEGACGTVEIRDEL